ncbi:MAG: helix-turn-helix transcriptional regulator [Lachnospiraceae bacterium]|nr:helix-turn-helix transcriptional regulator [Lachnospiraceae bacterium]
MNYFIESHLTTTENPIIEQPVMHSHDNYEIYLFLEGKNDYLVEGTRYRLRKGDIMLMRKGELHINHILTNQTYRRITVNFEITPLLTELNLLHLLDMFHNRPLGEYNHYCAKEFPGNHWMQYLHAVCSAVSREEKLCYLLPLLHELHQCFSRLSLLPANGEQNLVVDICKYINENLSLDLSLEQLSEKFYISKTHLNRLFHASLGTTAGQYIKLKRLFWAKEEIQQGGHPVEVYSKCGFHDYTTFYRAFKKQFSLSPKDIYSE